MEVGTKLVLFGANDDWFVTGIYKGECTELGSTWVELETDGTSYFYNANILLGFKIVK